MKKFNLALLPLTIRSQALQLAKRFAKLSDNYLLGEGSEPHITLCQFYAEESRIDELWEKASQAFSEKALRLDLNQVESKMIYGKLWIQLIPQPKERLHQLHTQLAKMVETPLGLVFEAYSPHLTLANIKKDQWENVAPMVTILQVGLSDEFILSLGYCDEAGQFTARLHSSSC